MKNRKKKGIAVFLVCTLVFTLVGSIPDEVIKAVVSISNPQINSREVIWDCIWFGNYYQNMTGEKEPIKWRVLSVENDEALLITDKSIDAKPYNDTDSNITWENCSLRSWLNTVFYKTAFSPDEQADIQSTKIINNDNPIYGTKGGSETIDNVYLLSIEEVSNNSYGFYNEFSMISNTRVAENTSYAKKCGAWSSKDGNSWWWLRSPGYDCNVVSYVFDDGFGSSDGFVQSQDGAVRPVIRIKLSSTCWSFAGTVSSEGETKEVPSIGVLVPTKTPIPTGMPIPELIPTEKNPPTITPFLQTTIMPEVTVSSTATAIPTILGTHKTDGNSSEQINDIVHQGRDGDIDWKISADGCLILEGNGDWKGCGNTVIMISPEEEKALPAWLDYYEDIVSAKIHIKGITNCSYLFDGLSNLKKIELTDLDTSKTTNMESMFRGCSSLTFIELINFDTSHVEDMSSMFANCEELERIDLRIFNTVSLKDMSNMFFCCKSLKQVDLTSFNTSQVKYMYGTFDKCESLENVDVTGFNTNNVLSMDSMFYGCDSLKELDLSSFDCSALKQRIGAFGGFSQLFSIEKIKTPRNLPEWLEEDDESNYSLSFENTNVQEWKGSDGERYTEFPLGMKDSITITRDIIEKKQFPKEGKILQLNWSIDGNGNLSIKGSGDYFDDDIEVWDEKPWMHWYKEIKSCTVDIKGITNTSYMFSGLKKMEKINFVNFNTSKVTDMREMFSNCECLKQVDVSHFNTSMVENMSGMFYGCKKLSALDVTSFDTKKVVDMSSMFYGCFGLEKLNMQNFVTSKVEDISEMFYSCHNLRQLLLGNWDTKEVARISRTFGCCHRLTNLDISGWNLSALGGFNPAYNLFDGCISLSQIKTPQNTKINISLPKGNWKENGKGKKYTNIPMNLSKSILLKNSEQTQYDWEKQGKIQSDDTKFKAKVKVKQAKSKKKKIYLSWKKVNNAKGYQIVYAANRNFKNKKQKVVKKTSIWINKLKRKTYYLKVRAYKLSSGKRIYGKWSSVKKVKIK